jgi:hypothetical protein
MLAYFSAPGSFEIVIVVIVVIYVLFRQGRRAESRDSVRPSEAKRSEATTTEASPSWRLPAGLISMALGLLAFCASAATGGGTAAGSLLAGLLNPIFFIGVPLGLYWLYQHERHPAAPSRPAEDGNPKLTHCPDCGRHMSRLAKMCPHCGRPMEPSSGS